MLLFSLPSQCKVEYVPLFFPAADVSCLSRVISACRSSACSLWFMAPRSNSVYLQSHDLRMTPTVLDEEGSEGQGGSHAETHTYTLNVSSLLWQQRCFRTIDCTLSHVPNTDNKVSTLFRRGLVNHVGCNFRCRRVVVIRFWPLLLMRLKVFRENEPISEKWGWLQLAAAVLGLRHHRHSEVVDKKMAER